MTLGRRCAIPDIHSSNGGIRSYAERNAVNYPVQGIIKVAMVKIFRRLNLARFCSFSETASTLVQARTQSMYCPA